MLPCSDFPAVRNGVDGAPMLLEVWAIRKGALKTMVLSARFDRKMHRFFEILKSLLILYCRRLQLPVL